MFLTNYLDYSSLFSFVFDSDFLATNLLKFVKPSCNHMVFLVLFSKYVNYDVGIIYFTNRTLI